MKMFINTIEGRGLTTKLGETKMQILALLDKKTARLWHLAEPGEGGAHYDQFAKRLPTPLRTGSPQFGGQRGNLYRHGEPPTMLLHYYGERARDPAEARPVPEQLKSP